MKVGQIYIFNGCIRKKHYMSPNIDDEWIDCDDGGYMILCPECCRQGQPGMCAKWRSLDGKKCIKDIPVYIVSHEDDGYYKVEIIWNQELEGGREHV